MNTPETTEHTAATAAPTPATEMPASGVSHLGHQGFAKAVPDPAPQSAPPLPARPVVPPPLLRLDDCQPIRGWWALLDALLKHPGRLINGVTGADSGRLTCQLLVMAFVGMAAYGVVVGLFPGDMQVAVVPLKLAVGLLASALICWPSLYILLCLSGARQSASEVVGLLASALALQVVLMAGFAPVAWIFTQSTHAAGFMGGLHLLLWLVSACFALQRLGQGLTALNGRAMQALPVWCLVFLVVCLQMTTSLRPLLGPFTGWAFATRDFFLHAWFAE